MRLRVLAPLFALAACSAEAVATEPPPTMIDAPPPANAEAPPPAVRARRAVREPNDDPRMRVDLELDAVRVGPGERPTVVAAVRNLSDEGFWVISDEPICDSAAARLQSVVVIAGGSGAHQRTTFEPARFWLAPRAVARARVRWAEDVDALPRWVPGRHTIRLSYAAPGIIVGTWSDDVSWELVDDGTAPDHGGVWVDLALRVERDEHGGLRGWLTAQDRELRPVTLSRWLDVEWHLGPGEQVTTQVVLAGQIAVPSLGAARVGPFALVPPEGTHPRGVRVSLDGTSSSLERLCPWASDGTWPSCAQTPTSASGDDHRAERLGRARQRGPGVHRSR